MKKGKRKNVAGRINERKEKKIFSGENGQTAQIKRNNEMKQR